MASMTCSLNVQVCDRAAPPPHSFNLVACISRPMSIPFWRYVATVAVFAVGGPIVGLILFAGLPSVLLSRALGGLPLFLAYAVGFVPALITGIIAALASRSGRLWVFLASAVAGGGIATAAFLFLTSGSFDEGAWMFTWIGVKAALICALISIPITKLKVPMLRVMASWDPFYVLMGVIGALCLILLGHIGFMLLT